MTIPRRGHSAGRDYPRPVFVLAEVGATPIAKFDLVKENASGTLEVAGAGDAVFGVADSQGDAGENVHVQVGGVRELDTTGSPGFSYRWEHVVAAGSNQVDNGSAGDPYFASLIEYRSADSRARVLLHADAIKTCARSIRTQGDETISVGDVTAGRPWVRSSSDRLETPRVAGTTAQRPGSGVRYDGATYYDTDVNALLVWCDALSRWVGPTQFLQLGYARSGSIGSFILRFQNNDMGWTNTPWVPSRAIEITNVGVATKGGTGGSTWTYRLRKNGSGTDLWTHAVVSATTWTTSVETVGVTFVAGDRIQFRADTGANEAIQGVLEVEFVPVY